MPVAARSKARVYGSWNCGLESRRGHRSLCVANVCVVRWRSLRRADSLSRGVVLSAMSLSVISEDHRGAVSPIGQWSRQGEKKENFMKEEHRVSEICILHYRDDANGMQSVR